MGETLKLYIADIFAIEDGINAGNGVVEILLGELGDI